MSTFTPPPDGRYTQRGNRLYLHLFACPFADVHLDGLRDRVEYAQFLHDASEVRFAGTHAARHLSDAVAEANPDALTLQIPVQPPNVLVPVIELFLKE